jgi:hypothetical protein
VQGTYFGSVVCDRDYFLFVASCQATPESYKFADRKNNGLEYKEFMVPWAQIDEIVKRKVVNVF